MQVFGNKRSWFNNRSLAGKIAAGFGLVIALSVIIAGNGYLGLGQTSEMFGEYRQTARENLLLSTMQEDMLEARLAVMKFRVTQDQSQVEEVRSNIAELSEEARGDIDTLVVDPNARAELIGVIDDAVAYGDRFEAATALQAKRQELVTALNTVGPEARKAISEIMSSAYEDGDVEAAFYAGLMQERLLLARLYVQRFLIQNDTGSVERAASEFAAAFENFQRLRESLQNPVRIELADTALDLIDGYSTAFNEVVQTIQARNAILIGELDRLGPAVMARMEQVIDARVSRQNEIGPASVEAIERTQIVTLAVGAAVVALALAVALFIGYITIVPIRRLTERMGEVAKGETGFEVRAENSSDEVGRMWSALATLRRAVEEAYQKAQMIEQLQFSVMVADPADDFKITYMNPAAEKLLREVEHMFDTKVDDMVGQSIDVFHKHAEHQRRILEDPTNLPWKARLNLENEKVFDSMVSAIRSKNGDYVGAMLGWNDVTQLHKMTDEFEANVKSAIGQVQTSFSHMTEQLDVMEQSVAVVQERSTEGAAAVNQATSNVQTVATATEELSASFKEIAHQMAETSAVASQATNKSADATKRAQDLASAGKRITEVVTTISDIAEQTNLLALNATIEAARAGEAGRGFAVVANEVKGLANETAKSTDVVRTELGAIQSMISDVVAGISSVSSEIGTMSEVFTSVASAVEEQEAATAEIARNVQEAASGTQVGADTILSVEKASQENKAVTEALTSVANELESANSRLAERSDEFLGMLKTG
ncbi:MAG: methyl-accepting chemotaxis protein [Alphaproteobacteria bacterium]|nr:methyl-accepting chemotaxis protein [Alphaproteobacteria bacterium]